MKQLLSVYKRLFGYAEGVSPPKRGKRKTAKKEKLAPLSSRNRKILDLIENGVSESKAIAEKLKLPKKTVNVELNYLESLGEI